MNIRSVIFFSISLGIIFLFKFLYSQNNDLKVSKAQINTRKTLDNFNIIHLSDLHTKSFGKDNRVLVNMVKNHCPDIIVITGDILDRRFFDLAYLENIGKELMKIAPVYYVTGNHEWFANKQDEIKKALIGCGVEVLNGNIIKLSNGKYPILISGIDDIKYSNIRLDEVLKEFSQHDGYKIFLSHQPEVFKSYWKYNMDLVLCGHAHGGQIRLPFIGGLIAPNQGFFPKYYEGIYSMNSTNMIVSRGLGNSTFPFRIFNKPEIVFIQIKLKS